MSDLFNRDFSMIIGGIPLEIQKADVFQSDKIEPSLKVEFSIERNSNKDPNKADITIYNLGPTNRAKIQEGADLIEKLRQTKPKPLLYDWPIVIEGGYVGSKERLFAGDITFANTRKDNVTWVTDIECGDGENKYRNERLNKSYGPGTPVTAVVTDLAAQLGIGPGNLAFQMAIGLYRKGYSVFTQGTSITGSAAENIDKILTSMGFQWSIQDGQLQILAPDETTFEEVVFISNKLGNLIGSPEKGDKGSFTVRSLLQGKLKPGRRVFVESNAIKGFFKIEKVTHFGDTGGNDWYSEVEVKPI
jgi:hypothetical protein